MRLEEFDYYIVDGWTYEGYAVADMDALSWVKRPPRGCFIFIIFSFFINSIINNINIKISIISSLYNYYSKKLKILK